MQEGGRTMQRNWRGFFAVIISAAIAAALTRMELPLVLVLALAMFAGGALLLVLDPTHSEDEMTLQAQEADLPSGFGRALLDNIPSPVFVINERGRVAYANRPMRSLVPRAEPGLHFSAIFRAPRFVEAVNKAFNSSPVRDIDFSALFGGTERVLNAHIAQLPPVSDFGPGAQVLVQIADLSDQRATEVARTDFIANASHELRTPLASILGYIETLRGHAKDDPEARAHFLGIMNSQAQRMQRLVEDLMSLTRIEMAAHSSPSEICDLYDTTREAVRALQPLAEKIGAELNLALPEEDLALIADRDQIAQVITNLTENALKYGGQGVSVTVSAASSVPPRPRMVGIAIEDTGPGIAREHLHRLTERFYRVSAKKSKEQGGTGLGLAIVKHILARHGGELAVESELEQGSSFTIWLPVSQN